MKGLNAVCINFHWIGIELAEYFVALNYNENFQMFLRGSQALRYSKRIHVGPEWPEWTVTDCEVVQLAPCPDIPSCAAISEFEGSTLDTTGGCTEIGEIRGNTIETPKIR